MFPFSQNALLPAGLRQRDQTKKSPTGPYDRDALMQHLEKVALEHKDREDLVPFTGEKKGGRPHFPGIMETLKKGLVPEPLSRHQLPEQLPQSFSCLSHRKSLRGQETRRDPGTRAGDAGAGAGGGSEERHGRRDV